MSTDIRPNFTIARCCRNCKFYRANYKQHRYGFKGLCLLSQIVNKKNTPLTTHGTGICDAHIWKSDGSGVQRAAISIGAEPPEDSYKATP